MNLANEALKLTWSCCLASTLLVFVALVGISTTYAKATEIDELNSAAGQDAILLARIHAQLVSYDRVLQMRTARGALTSQQADSLLQRRLDDLAKAPSAPTAQTREEREEAKLFFDFIERTAASSAHWPSVTSTAMHSSR